MQFVVDLHYSLKTAKKKVADVFRWLGKCKLFAGSSRLTLNVFCVSMVSDSLSMVSISNWGFMRSTKFSEKLLSYVFVLLFFVRIELTTLISKLTGPKGYGLDTWLEGVFSYFTHRVCTFHIQNSIFSHSSRVEDTLAIDLVKNHHSASNRGLK